MGDATFSIQPCAFFYGERDSLRAKQDEKNGKKEKQRKEKRRKDNGTQHFALIGKTCGITKKYPIIIYFLFPAPSLPLKEEEEETQKGMNQREGQRTRGRPPQSFSFSHPLLTLYSLVPPFLPPLQEEDEVREWMNQRGAGQGRVVGRSPRNFRGG